MEKHAVVSPLGLEVVKAAGSAKRLEQLDGKTIGEFWNGVFKGDASFPIIRRLLQQRYPGLKIVPFNHFPHAPGSDHPSKQRDLARRMALMAKEKGCDAVISGNGA